MNVRRARPSESEELSALAIASKASWGYSAQQLALWAVELRLSPESILGEPSFVAEQDGQVIGVAQLDTTASPWSVACLWVHPSRTRQGVGTSLLRHLLAYAQGEGQSQLRVDADPNAEAFYLRLGARRVGEIPAPVEGQPGRARPQLVLGIENAA